MPAEPVSSAIPGLPAETAELVVTALGGLCVVVAAPVLAAIVRRSLAAAGLRAPRPDDPGIDWGRVAGLLVGLVVVCVSMPALLPASMGDVARKLMQTVLSSLRPVVAPLFILAVGDHYQRVLRERAAKAKSTARDALTLQDDQLRVGTYIVAGIALMGDGLFAAWPLGVLALVVWAMHDPKLRPVFDRTLADLRAGWHLRKTATWTEGRHVQLDGESVVLAGPVGWVDTRVHAGATVRLVRNVVLLQTDGALAPLAGPLEGVTSVPGSLDGSAAGGEDV